MELSWWKQPRRSYKYKIVLFLLVLTGLPMFLFHRQLSTCTSRSVDSSLNCRRADQTSRLAYTPVLSDTEMLVKRIKTGLRDRDIDVVTSRNPSQARRTGNHHRMASRAGNHYRIASRTGNHHRMASRTENYHRSLRPEPHCYGWHGLDLKTKDIGLLIAVKTAPERVEKRQKLRERWAGRCLNGELNLPIINAGLPGGSRVKCVFVIGRLKGGDEKSLKRQLEKEKGDIVFAPMADIYETMTSKTMWTLQWSLRTYCYRHLLFVDDDTHIFFSRLLPYMSATGSKHQVGFYLGHSHWSFNVIHCSFFGRRKNCIDWNIYPRRKFFPYASGFAYLMSRDVVEKAVQMALIHVSQPLSLPGNSEDSMIGEVIHEANVTLTHHAGFVHWESEAEHCPMMVQHNSPVLVVGNAPDDILDRLAANEELDKPLCTDI